MTVRFPKNSAVAALVDRLQHRIDALLRDFEGDLDDVLQEQHRASNADSGHYLAANLLNDRVLPLDR
jgi:hypothetical protein